MTEQQFLEITGLGYEKRGVEFKGPGPRTDRNLFAKVTRAALGMANKRDGGTIIVGIDENGAGINLTGLSPADTSSWNYDDVMAGISAYADPEIDLDIGTVKCQGKEFLVIQVYEFREVPILCKKSYQAPPPQIKEVLREGACYVRSRKKPETSEIANQTDMRELIDLSVEKGIRRFSQQLHLVVGSLPPATPKANDTDAFNKQLEELKR